MTLRHLEIFLEVKRSGSITKAADRLNMAQPAVSRVIRELENFYGTKLFERMNRKLYITEAGEQLFLYADSIIAQYYEAKNVLLDRTLAAKIRIGSNATCGQQLLPELLQKFRQAHPEILFICAKDYPVSSRITFAQLEDLPLLVREPGSGGWTRTGSYKTIELQDPPAKRTYCLVYHKSKYLTRSMKYFQGFVRKNCT